MDHASQVWMAFAVWMAAALIPLIPAIAIYKLFPDTKVAVTGPLSGLTLRAGGAFGVYVVVFLLTSALPFQVIELIEANVSAAWHVTFRQIHLVGANGKTIDDPALLSRVQITLKPEFFGVGGAGSWAKVPETDGKLPTIVLTIPGGRGYKEVHLQNEVQKADVRVDKARHEISLMSPVSLRVYEDKAPYPASGEAPSPVDGALLPPAGQQER
ncbi:hypothetical protein [Piscinibacter sp. XHJ-5]|uniref:hypothetical protein n=1 Tax=Piscinibacter sp. XHJ-5 TaxID=3037797 RepID=UPI00245311A6|nr:hypothetical protein [Piscinibacter sp. XHJ-5]